MKIKIFLLCSNISYNHLFNGRYLVPCMRSYCNYYLKQECKFNNNILNKFKAIMVVGFKSFFLLLLLLIDLKNSRFKVTYFINIDLKLIYIELSS